MNKIKEIAKSKGITIKNIIDETGISKSYMYDVVNGNSIPTVVMALKISVVLGSKVEELFPII